MRPARQANVDLDNPIEEISIDSYSEDEQVIGFETACYGATLSCPDRIAGEKRRRALARHRVRPPQADPDLLASRTPTPACLLDIEIQGNPATSSSS